MFKRRLGSLRRRPLPNKCPRRSSRGFSVNYDSVCYFCLSCFSNHNEQESWESLLLYLVGEVWLQHHGQCTVASLAGFGSHHSNRRQSVLGNLWGPLFCRTMIECVKCQRCMNWLLEIGYFSLSLRGIIQTLKAVNSRLKLGPNGSNVVVKCWTSSRVAVSPEEGIPILRDKVAMAGRRD